MAQGCHQIPVQGEQPALQMEGTRMQECSELFGPFISKGSFLLCFLLSILQMSFASFCFSDQMLSQSS